MYSLGWTIERNDVWASTTKYLEKISARDFARTAIEIYFSNEEGLDSGWLIFLRVLFLPIFILIIIYLFK